MTQFELEISFVLGTVNFIDGQNCLLYLLKNGSRMYVAYDSYVDAFERSVQVRRLLEEGRRVFIHPKYPQGL